MLTSHELFGFMSPGLADEIITFTLESDKPVYKRHAQRRCPGAALAPGFP